MFADHFAASENDLLSDVKLVKEGLAGVAGRVCRYFLLNHLC